MRSMEYRSTLDATRTAAFGAVAAVPAPQKRDHTLPSARDGAYGGLAVSAIDIHSSEKYFIKIWGRSSRIKYPASPPPLASLVASSV